MSRDLSRIEKAFIEKIKEALKEKGKKPVWLARELGYSDAWISNIMRYKRGEKTLTIKLLYDIAGKLNIDPASLLPERTESEPKISSEEYIRRIIRDELEKIKKK